jgi:hypothetical protein
LVKRPPDVGGLGNPKAGLPLGIYAEFLIEDAVANMYSGIADVSIRNCN